MKPFNILRKWFVYFLLSQAPLIVGGVFLLFCIMACDDGVNFATLSYFDCEENEETEGVFCEEEDDDESGFSASISITKIKTKLGKVDIFFVIDNSQSMKEEQESIAHQFDSFLEDIEDKEVDYHIAMITTDVSDGGRFLEFPNGEKFLSNPDRKYSVHNDNVRHFRSTVQMGVKNTDSANDERGIYNLNKVLETEKHSDFFRLHSLLMVIIVSDEDERSYGGRDISKFPALEEEDKPETFFKKFSRKHRFSTVVVHSIIVKPGDRSCQFKPDGITVKGNEGYIYAEASEPSDEMLRRYGNIQTGHIGSICATDYSSQLGPIAGTLEDVPVSLPCFPAEDSVSVKVDGEEVEFQVEKRQVIIEERVDFDAEVDMRFKCQSGQKE